MVLRSLSAPTAGEWSPKALKLPRNSATSNCTSNQTRYKNRGRKRDRKKTQLRKHLTPAKHSPIHRDKSYLPPRASSEDGIKLLRNNSSAPRLACDAINTSDRLGAVSGSNGDKQPAFPKQFVVSWLWQKLPTARQVGWSHNVLLRQKLILKMKHSLKLCIKSVLFSALEKSYMRFPWQESN